MSVRPIEFRLLAADRGEGKTTQAFAWVSRGVPVPGYPGWSRVLVLPTKQDFRFHREQYWSRLDDYDHRVYELHDWSGARGVADVDVCVDGLERVMGSTLLSRMPGRFVAATINAQPWEPQTFVDRVVAERSGA